MLTALARCWSAPLTPIVVGVDLQRHVAEAARLPRGDGAARRLGRDGDAQAHVARGRRRPA